MEPARWSLFYSLCGTCWNKKSCRPVNVIKLVTPAQVRVQESEYSGGAVLTFLKAGMAKEQTMSVENADNVSSTEPPEKYIVREALPPKIFNLSSSF